MKQFRYSLILLVAFQVASYVAQAAQKDGIRKVIKKEFAVQPDATLRLDNRFGDIACTIWDKNEISVEVTLSVETKSQETAEKFFSKVDIYSLGSESKVEVTTKLAKNMNSKGHFSIDYNVMMPASVVLDLSNEFGDVMITELFAKSAIRVAYGKASIGKLNHGDNLLKISFGSATVKSMKGAVVSMEFSKMRLDYAGSLRINSKYSDVDAGEVIVMEGTVEGGKIDLQQTSVLTIETKLSSFTVGSVKQKIVLDAEFGSFNVETVSPEFKSLVVENQHGSVGIGIPETLGYTLDAKSQFGSIKFSKTNASFSLSNVSGQEEIYKGIVGENPTANVKIRNEFGSINLKP
ncbi:MAG: hypothetical protein IH596_14765 [Bacteroidales bacterium]|nr:hypothetical protein [Bacteroidales bacterium]